MNAVLSVSLIALSVEVVVLLCARNYTICLNLLNTQCQQILRHQVVFTIYIRCIDVESGILNQSGSVVDAQEVQAIFSHLVTVVSHDVLRVLIEITVRLIIHVDLSHIYSLLCQTILNRYAQLTISTQVSLLNQEQIATLRIQFRNLDNRLARSRVDSQLLISTCCINHILTLINGFQVVSGLLAEVDKVIVAVLSLLYR